MNTRTIMMVYALLITSKRWMWNLALYIMGALSVLFGWQQKGLAFAIVLAVLLTFGFFFVKAVWITGLRMARKASRR
jgi:hypothetical protein